MGVVARSSTPLRRLLHIAAIPAAALLAFAIWFLSGWGGPTAIQVAVGVGALGPSVFAAVSAGVAARRTRHRQRQAWVFMALGLAAWAFSEIAVLYHRFWRGSVHPLYPSAANVGFLLFPVAACIAMLAFPAGYSGGVRFRMALDGAIVAASLFVVAWVAVLRQAYAATEVNPAALLSLAYPAAEVMTVTVAILVLARAHARWRITIFLLTVGLTLIAASGSAYAYLLAHNHYAFDSPMGLGWLAGLMIVGIAAFTSPTEQPYAPPTPSASSAVSASMWLPYIPLAIAGGLELVAFRSSVITDPAFAVVPWLVIAVLARQFLVVAENRRLLHSASDRALRDPLTNLANRLLFHDRLEHAIQLYHRDNRSVAVLSMDLDDFKLINDNLGHVAGDALLIQAGQRLLGCTRPGDTVARLGGDEFGVLIEDAGENAHLIAYQIMEAFERPFSTDGEVIFMRPSAGLAVADADDSDLSGPELLKHADTAMYSAKRQRGGLQTYSPDLHLSDNALSALPASDVLRSRGGLMEIRLLSDLRQAISRRALTVLYQPKVDLRTTEVVGAEALVRWPHAIFGLVRPQQFLPLVRQHGLMRRVTDLVLDQALGDAAQWRLRGVAMPVAVNLFPPLVGDVTLPSQIFDALARHDLPGDSLIIEITEDLLLDNIDRTRNVLEALRERNIHIALDDFGSGYSALTYLRKLPIDEVKVDHDLIGHVLIDPRADAIVRAVVNLAQALNVTTVAEGVENADIAAYLRDCGCEVAQGIYYSPPIAADAMMEQMTSPASW